MMIKYIYILIVFTSVCLDGYAQKATLSFRAPKEEMTIRIFKPIDGFPNITYYPDELIIHPNESVNYELDVTDFGFVTCRFSNGMRREFLVFPGDYIEITCELQKITLSGSNAEGHNYYNNNYVIAGALGGLDGRIVERYIKKGSPIIYDSIYHYVQQEILSNETDLKKMAMLNLNRNSKKSLDVDGIIGEFSSSITPEFSAVLAQNLFFSVANTLTMIYGGLIKNATGFRPPSFAMMAKEIIPSEEDVQTMKKQLSALLESPNILSNDAARLPYSSGSLYALKYNLLMDDDTKLKKMRSYDTAIFGENCQYLLAPDKMQLRIFSGFFMEHFRLNFNLPGNSEKLLAYMDKKYPDSEYVAIIKELINEKNLKEISNEVVMLADSISSLEELMQQPEIKGKYAYVDLWSTWCAPCLAEFAFHKDVHKVLSHYKSIIPIYISIDKKENKQNWKNQVAKHNLKGYNVLASELLQKDIAMKVYSAKKVGRIPRYFLVSPEGKILNNFMPKPSNSANMKKELSKILE